MYIPRVLYHWRAVPGSVAANPLAKPYAWHAGQRAVQAHVGRVGIDADVTLGSCTGTYVLHRRLPRDVRISVIIPTRGSEGIVWGERRTFVVEAVRSLLAMGGHANVEVVVVHDPDTSPPVLDELRRVGGDSLRLVPFHRPFNFSEKCNLGVVSSNGDVVVLLNDDIEISSENFLANLVAPLLEAGVGLTGANLAFSDGSVQHAGLVMFKHGPGHMYDKKPGGWPGPFNTLTVNRECSGLTGAALAVLRSTYYEVGGMTESLPLSYNDVDFSFKIARLGLRRLWIANARAYHFESKSRVPTVQPWERELLFRGGRRQTETSRPQIGTPVKRARRVTPVRGRSGTRRRRRKDV